MTVKKSDLAAELIDDLLAEESAVLPEEASPTSSELDLANGDETVRLGDSKILSHVKPRPLPFPTAPSAPNSSVLLQVENLRVAQQKILDLEEELVRLREENEQLVAAGEALHKENEVLSTQVEAQSLKVENLKQDHQEEKHILSQALTAKDKQIKELRVQVSEFESRLTLNLRKIRVRERELENRLELQKMENSAMSKSKDETLLDLKRQVDTLSFELDNYQTKTQEIGAKLKQKSELLNRTLKALRLATSMLENESDDGDT